jgi:hypothetical protein
MQRCLKADIAVLIKLEQGSFCGSQAAAQYLTCQAKCLTHLANFIFSPALAEVAA